MCLTVPRPVPLTCQCAIRYHDQCLSLGNVSYGTTTSATWQCTIWYYDQCNMTMRHMVTQPVYFTRPICHTVPRPVSFTWQCVIRYHDQCLSSGNVFYGTTTSAFHLAMCHTVPRLVPFTWQCVIRYHDQCLPYDTLPCEIHWSWYCMTHCQVIGTGRGTVRHIVR
jgi:hypothetical protein